MPKAYAGQKAEQKSDRKLRDRKWLLCWVVMASAEALSRARNGSIKLLFPGEKKSAALTEGTEEACLGGHR